MVPSPELREALGISPNRDLVILSRKRLEEILQFERQIEIDQQFYASEGRFEDGLFKMRNNIRELGQPHSAILMRILARLRHHSAWFSSISGALARPSIRLEVQSLSPTLLFTSQRILSTLHELQKPVSSFRWHISCATCRRHR